MVEQPTIENVARRAGVSLGSASRALNHKGASAAMIARVEQAADELGYRPSALGRSLRTKRTFQIAFAVADIGNPIYVEMLDAASSIVAPHGYRIVVLRTGASVRSTLDLIADLDSGFVDGLIISPLRSTPELADALREAAVPVAVLGSPEGEPRVDTVSVDSAAGIEMVADHLVGQGARRLVFLNGPLETVPGASRRRGIEQAARRHADVIDSLVFVEAEDFTAEAAVAALDAAHSHHLDLLSNADALIAANDVMAVGAIRFAKLHGVGVPSDLLVTGMDDTELARLYDPSLTSVSTHSARRAEKAATLLLGAINGDEAAVSATVVKPELVVRESSTPANVEMEVTEVIELAEIAGMPGKEAR